MEFKQITDEAEIKLLIEAWKEAFARKFDDAIYEWMFNKKNSLYAVFADGKVVAGYCLLRYGVVFNQQLVAGALCNNVFVVPQFQKKHLFAALGQFALHKAAEDGIKIIIGMPNGKAIFGHQLVGWTFLAKIQFLEKHDLRRTITSIDPNIRLWDAKHEEHYLAGIARLSLNMARQRSFSVIKDEEFLRWRYLHRPSNNYKICLYVQHETVLGYIVYKYYEPFKRLHILDVEAENAEIFRKLLELIADFPEDYMLVNVWGSSIYQQHFFDVGFKLSEEYNYLMAICPGVEGKVTLGSEVNIVLADNEVF